MGYEASPFFSGNLRIDRKDYKDPVEFITAIQKVKARGPVGSAPPDSQEGLPADVPDNSLVCTLKDESGHGLVAEFWNLDARTLHRHTSLWEDKEISVVHIDPPYGLGVDEWDHVAWQKEGVTCFIDHILIYCMC